MKDELMDYGLEWNHEWGMNETTLDQMDHQTHRHITSPSQEVIDSKHTIAWCKPQWPNVLCHELGFCSNERLTNKPHGHQKSKHPQLRFHV